MNILCFPREYRCFQAEHFCLYQKYIIFFQETKTDNLDHLTLPDGFTYVAKHRKKCLKKSGGIVTIFKKSLSYLLEFPETSSEYVSISLNAFKHEYFVFSAGI
jgi:hypothetical protein